MLPSNFPVDHKIKWPVNLLKKACEFADSTSLLTMAVYFFWRTCAYTSEQKRILSIKFSNPPFGGRHPGSGLPEPRWWNLRGRSCLECFKLTGSSWQIQEALNAYKPMWLCDCCTGALDVAPFVSRPVFSRTDLSDNVSFRLGQSCQIFWNCKSHYALFFWLGFLADSC